MTVRDFLGEPAVSVSATVLLYAVSLVLYRRWKWMNPILITAGGLTALLMAAGVTYDEYREGGDMISLLLGPATVALGVPMYRNAGRIRRRLAAVLAGVTVGTAASMISAGVLIHLLHGSRDLMLAMVPKSATTPISIEIVRELGGMPELGAVLTVLTGLLGSLIGPELLRLCGVRGDIAIGAAIGTAAHGIGTARVLRESDLQGSAAGLSMAAAGIVTSLLAIPLYGWL